LHPNTLLLSLQKNQTGGLLRRSSLRALIFLPVFFCKQSNSKFGSFKNYDKRLKTIVKFQFLSVLRLTFAVLKIFNEKIVTLTFLRMLFRLCFFAQGSKRIDPVQGTVIDSAARQPLEFATVTLFSKGSKKPATGSITDATGKFVINDAGEGIFTVLIESIGYKSFSINDITISKADKQKDLGIIKLVTC
jgi:hypothetical protein